MTQLKEKHLRDLEAYHAEIDDDKSNSNSTNLVRQLSTMSATLKEAIGFRRFSLILHGLINASNFLVPFFVWYFNGFKLPDRSQKHLPYSQWTLFYSYSINEGMIALYFDIVQQIGLQILHATQFTTI